MHANSLRQVRMDVPDKVKAILRDLPDKPGCYLMRDARGRIIYVGKAISLRHRVQCYFRASTRRSGDPKLRGLVKSVADLEYIVVRNEAEALLTEGRLIKEYKPRYNVDFRDDKRFLMLRGDPAEPWPTLRTARIRRPDTALYFGPYVSSAAARATLDFVEKHYGLRKCAPRVPDASTYRHCLNDIIRFCSAPCVGRIAPEEYAGRFAEACAFLRGERPAVLKHVREAMAAAADARAYEQAAVLRDTLHHLLRTVRTRLRAARPTDLRRADAVTGLRALQAVLGLPAPPAVIEAFDVSTISGTYAVASLVSAVEGVPHRQSYRRFRIHTVAGSDDPRMIAEAVRRRYSRLQAEGGSLPGLVLVDGGLTQLRAARAALAELGLAGLPVAGLAKRFEELYTADTAVPVRLPDGSPALRMLQQLRDEAHRFALDYHRRLRNRRIRESALDEVPGIGPARKRLLLQRFGSVHRLALAQPEQVAAMPGIGYELARAVLAAVGGEPDAARPDPERKV